MPLELTDQEKDLLLELAMPIAYGQRPQFLREVAAALETARKAKTGPAQLSALRAKSNAASSSRRGESHRWRLIVANLARARRAAEPPRGLARARAAGA